MGRGGNCMSYREANLHQTGKEMMKDATLRWDSRRRMDCWHRTPVPGIRAHSTISLTIPPKAGVWQEGHRSKRIPLRLFDPVFLIHYNHGGRRFPGGPFRLGMETPNFLWGWAMRLRARTLHPRRMKHEAKRGGKGGKEEVA